MERVSNYFFSLRSSVQRVYRIRVSKEGLSICSFLNKNDTRGMARTDGINLEGLRICVSLFKGFDGAR